MVANNASVFNAAIGGAAGGAASRWITNQNVSDYNDIAFQCLLFGTAVDLAIPAEAAISTAENDLMESICAQVVASRWFPTGNDIDDYRDIALSIKAMWTCLRAVMQPTAAGDIVPLSDVRYVDANTTIPAANRNGSQAAPFSTIQAAVNNLGSTVGTIYIAVGTYAEAVSTSVGHQFIGLTSNRSVLPTVTSITTTGSASLHLSLLSVTTVTAVINCIASLCVIGTATVGTGFTLSQVSIGAFSTGNIASAVQCIFSGAITLVTAAGVSRFTGGNQFLAAADITGPGGTSTVVFDSESMARFRAVSNTITTVATITVQSRIAFATVSVAVPALAAATTGEVAVNVSAVLELAGITTAEMVIANPPIAALAPGVGLNNGGYLSCRVTATNVITFTFIGALTGGAVNFLVGRPTAV